MSTTETTSAAQREDRVLERIDKFRSAGRGCLTKW